MYTSLEHQLKFVPYKYTLLLLCSNICKTYSHHQFFNTVKQFLKWKFVFLSMYVFSRNGYG